MISRALVPLFTATAYGTRQRAANSSSNCRPFWPRVSAPVLRHSLISALIFDITSFENEIDAGGTLIAHLSANPERHAERLNNCITTVAAIDPSNLKSPLINE